MNKTGSSERRRVALIAGPTASGKSTAALALAEAERGTIINADASQVYRDLRVLTARPSPQEEMRVPHRLYGHRDGAQPCSAADWAEEAKGAIAEVHAAGRLPILVGGTGLYLRVLLDGIAPVPAIDPAIRSAVRALDAAAAHAALAREDAAVAERLHPNDTTRLQRALEVVRSTGRSLSAWQGARTGGIAASHDISVTLVDPPVSELYARCDARLDLMIAAGALDEVRALIARGLPADLPVMRAIGVAPLAAYLEGRASYADAVDLAKRVTRQYAKRQRTWFRHQMPFEGPLHGHVVPDDPSIERLGAAAPDPV